MYRVLVSCCGIAAILVSFGSTCLGDVELIQLTKDNYEKLAPKGKEVDAIYGDWILRNQHVQAVIANPTRGRKANMTVRGVGGLIIDYSTRFNSSDQLSCFYPGGGKYLFENSAAEISATISGVSQVVAAESHLKAKQIEVSVKGTSVAANGTSAVVTYVLKDDSPWLEYQMKILNEAQSSADVQIEDSLRCDGNLFKTGDRDGAFYATDEYFGQAYLFMWDDLKMKRQGSGRNMVLKPESATPIRLQPSQDTSWSGRIYCSQGLVGIDAIRNAYSQKAEDRALDLTDVILLLRSKAPRAPIAHAEVEYFRGSDSLGSIRTSANGFVRTKLPAGDYVARIKAMGHTVREHEFTVGDRAKADTLTLEPASRVRAIITDAEKRPIAAKTQFIGLGDTPNPDFGPDSAIYAVKNAVYCANGKFEQAIPPGQYRVIVSHGPEFDAEMFEIDVSPGQLVPIKIALPQVVDSTGWVSAEFHSHSSPSGDNVSHQTGRVLNLLAEHLEFAPCTEHNRIDTYADDLQLLNATSAMATCTGMELTGGPLPINHQNAFPLVHHMHEQDGGGPQTDSNPVKQIERLALWDNNAPKVIQTNHPNIPSILGDKDLDGKPDDGFRGMLGWMDVIEVHPPEGIFNWPEATVAPDDRRNPIFYWMQLLNLGYRITGVVNTDAHYNFHGSGPLRNYLASSTDDPAQISIEEMIHASEHGHLVMTTGPFLRTEIRTSTVRGLQATGVGEDWSQSTDPSKLWIQVQCANWMDINRVQVFANGQPLESMNFTRKEDPDYFSDDVVRFELEIGLPDFTQDTHLIVAAIGEGLELGPVMGPTQGKLPPIAVTNPIFVDVDGSGFQGNGDDLGVPLMLDVPAK